MIGSAAGDALRLVVTYRTSQQGPTLPKRHTIAACTKAANPDKNVTEGRPKFYNKESQPDTVSDVSAEPLQPGRHGAVRR